MTLTDRSQPLYKKPPLTPIIIFSFSFLLLAASWLILFYWITLFTESHLVPWYCCAPDPVPDPGTWQRTVNDFFLGFPGRILPSLLFISASAAIFARRTLRVSSSRVWLPLFFFFANVIFIATATTVVNASWAVSNAVVGPRAGGIDAGFHRTWYGIFSHLFLCVLFFVVLARARLHRSSDPL